MLVLGIESSCDETSVAIVNHNKEILSLFTLSQLEEHRPFGGVVPEIAARSHIEQIINLVQKALINAAISLKNIDAFAVTAGPGLIGGVLVGVMTAKALASVAKKPFIAVNHLEGHALTVRLTLDIEFPYLMLLVSGGHCQILEVLGVGKYKRLGATLDDAVGEAFDKVAKMLGLGYPGGVEIEKLAKLGNPNAFNFPKPLLNQNNCDFSFAGLKTAVKRTIDQTDNINKADVCASFQHVVAEILCKKAENAIKIFRESHPYSNSFVIAGGVAANLYIREKLQVVLEQYNFNLYAPPVHLCTDNAAMIAWVGVERFKLGITDSLNFEPRSRWPLEELNGF
ncbi:O-sialoglycoprotein endopeptidase [endosymbiont of Acanthamoeba sp. UWC8]|uniref:tRNA (adenosine(37)-N6)-threonylcarbamoyltransferase complex transferase subunit TsaD n=1 Tax=endosymbiont of Acanthamoeba sp. UWC8 TaxID=86106 RepID=UPI0004D15578|nr:tRNA (adenosine(37)-N6)-threonylcarbamoyltransferase complex transferase subunit TsaD [endosymbiont of Acanthamoeba sp. UWC8]AIF81705.1 O-sialoglycoprotein endopeptidase [endosymbiont of Acanthamoeba sp. UWC8]